MNKITDEEIVEIKKDAQTTLNNMQKSLRRGESEETPITISVGGVIMFCKRTLRLIERIESGQ